MKLSKFIRWAAPQKRWYQKPAMRLVSAAIRQPKKRQTQQAEQKRKSKIMARLAKAPIGQQIARIDAKCRVDRGTPVTFTFDRRTYGGFAGDTLASALLANGVHLVGRSFKYHRPRGILSAGSEEPCSNPAWRGCNRRTKHTSYSN